MIDNLRPLQLYERESVVCGMWAGGEGGGGVA